MALRWVLAPLHATGLSAQVVAAFAFGRRDARAFMPRWPMVWFGLLAVLFALVALRHGVGPQTWVAPGAVGRGVGLGLLVVAAGLAVEGSRTRLSADTLRGEPPRSLDEGVEVLRAGCSPGWGVYRGRLASSDELLSPGGVVCAFYEAELRGALPDGRKGPLLSVERAYAPVLWVRGARVQAAVSFSPQRMLTPQRIRRCGPRVVPGVLEKGQPEEEEEVLSYERVGKLGEECLVVGELRKGPVPGVYELRGRRGGPAMVILGEAGEETGARLARRAWKLFAAAGGLTVASACMLAA